MMRNILVMIALMLGMIATAQVPTEQKIELVSSGVPVDFPDKEPQFPGGSSALSEFIQTNLKYPEVARENEDMGRVYVAFVVEVSGEITEVRILRGVTPELDAEAIRLVQMMPNWIPAEKGGEPVRARSRLPFSFYMK